LIPPKGTHSLFRGGTVKRGWGGRRDPHVELREVQGERECDCELGGRGDIRGRAERPAVVARDVQRGDVDRVVLAAGSPPS